MALLNRVFSHSVTTVVLLRGLLLLLSKSTIAVSMSVPHSPLNQTQTKNRQRPIINTFFERIDYHHRYTGMSDEADQALLEFWKQAWFDAGWEPRVLSLQDSQKHGDYELFRIELEKVIRTDNDRMASYMHMRWLAMATVGGGFMVDYDVFPIRDFLAHAYEPNERFRNKNNKDYVYCGGEYFVLYDNWSPSLAFGNATMWSRIGWALIEIAKKQQQQQHHHSVSIAPGEMNNSVHATDDDIHKQQTIFWTDSLGLLELSRSTSSQPEFEFVGKCVRSRKSVVDAALVLKSLDLHHNLQTQNCEQRPLRGRLAIQFGTHALWNGVVQPEHRLPQHRLTVAKEWLGQWSRTCNGTKLLAVE